MYLNYRENDADVIIIGSGITGLSAANFLLERDPHIDFLILDVNEKARFGKSEDLKLWNEDWFSKIIINQEIKTRFIDDIRFDRIIKDVQYFSKKQLKLTKLLNELNINMNINKIKSGLTLIDHEEIYKIYGRENIKKMFTTKELQELGKYCSEIDELSKKVTFNEPRKYTDMLEYDQINFDYFLRKLIDNKKIKDFFTQTFLINSGLRAKEVTTLFYLAYCNSIGGVKNQFHMNSNGIHQYLIEDGAENIRTKLTTLIGDDMIKYVSKILKITWNEFNIKIKTTDEDFFTNRIIFTLNESEINDIKFVPSLPDEKIIISNNITKPSLKKFHIIYDKPFWLEKNLSGDVYIMNNYNKNGPIQICTNISNDKSEIYILTGLANKDSLENDILNQLSFYFGETALFPKYYTENDTSYFDLKFSGGFKSMNRFEHIRDNTERIIWACPETTTEWYGTLEGSLEAGYNGAIRYIIDAKPNMVSLQDLQTLNPFQVDIPPSLPYIGRKWHIIVPSLLIAIFVVIKLRKYFVKHPKVVK